MEQNNEKTQDTKTEEDAKMRSSSNQKPNKRKRMTEEEKKKKWGDKYDPNFKRKSGESNGGSEDTKHDNEERKDERARRFNDWRFYALSEEIAKDIGSFPYNTLAGVKQIIERNVGDKFQWNNSVVARIDYINAQIANGDTDQGISVAANQLYTFLRHANTGAKNYEPADAIMYVLAMRDIYASYAELRRAIGFVNYFVLTNRAVPRQFIEAMGFDYEDLVDNYTLYRGQLNLIAKRINSIAVPKYFNAFERSDFVTGNIFADSDSVRGQFYVYVKQGSYTWSTTTSESGTELVFEQRPNSAKWSEMYTRLKKQVQAVYEDTDGATISGDVLHAFKDAEIYQIGQITDDFSLHPIMDEDALAQIENMTLLSAYCGNANLNQLITGLQTRKSLNVTQANGQLVWVPTYVTSGAPAGTFKIPRRVLFNSHSDTPTYKDNLEWSRLITVAEAVMVGNAETVQVTACGMELVLTMSIFTPWTSSSKFLNWSQMWNIGTSGTVSISALTTAIIIEQFDWHPFEYVFQGATDAVGTVYTGGDIKKFTWIELNTVAATHDAANQACFFGDNLYALKRGRDEGNPNK